MQVLEIWTSGTPSHLDGNIFRYGTQVQLKEVRSTTTNVSKH
jgi:hypothetical protein